MQEVDHTVRMLMQSPGIGPIEPLFADRPKAYRSVIINGLNKLVYYVENDAIIPAETSRTGCPGVLLSF